MELLEQQRAPVRRNSGPTGPAQQRGKRVLFAQQPLQSAVVPLLFLMYLFLFVVVHFLFLMTLFLLYGFVVFYLILVWH